MALSFGCFSRSAPATVFHCVTASGLVSCAKMVFSMAMTAARCLAGARARAFRIQ